MWILSVQKSHFIASLCSALLLMITLWKVNTQRYIQTQIVTNSIATLLFGGTPVMLHMM